VSTVEDRLADLGLIVPDVAKPVAAYLPAVRDGNLIFTSGQLPMVSGALARTGKVGDSSLVWPLGDLVPAEDAKLLAQTCALNAIAAVKSVIGDLDKVTRVVKVVGFVASHPSFTGQPGVINGASELLGKAFGDAGVHARSAVGVAVLPLDAPVEVEIIVSVQD
jgi:enamine deaminase RidA (YjgF/YER057c/UK114 family)